MTGGQSAVLAVIAVLAAAPVALVLVSGSRHPTRPRLSPGRFFLAYASLFSIALLTSRYLAFPAALSLLGIVLGWLGTTSGKRVAYRLAFGESWLSAQQEIETEGLVGWQVAAWVGSVLAITLALVLTYPLLSEGGG